MISGEIFLGLVFLCDVSNERSSSRLMEVHTSSVSSRYEAREEFNQL